ncbi:MAG TPA: FkbM family methyltransferase [Anaerolineales bacterium]
MSKYLMRLLAANVLPTPILTWVKKQYYVRSVKTFWEDDVEPIKVLVKPGDSVIDMGANFGWYTNVLSSMVGPTGKVYSIEPIPDTFEVLSGIVRKLGLVNVLPMNYAMSKSDGTTVMRVPQHEYGGSNFYRAQIDLKEGATTGSIREYTVPMRSLDSLFLNVAGKITFIKCDVEGHELAVVNGGAQFLGQARPAWLMEVGGDPDDEGTPPHQLFHIMKEYGYQVYFFDGKLLRVRPAGHWSVNYLLLQPDHCRRLAHMMAKE